MKGKLRQVTAMLMFAMACAPAAAQTPVDEPPSIEVMVVGTYHFGNPGQDLYNVAADDVTSPLRQAELERISAALAEFAPTKIMVERQAQTADLIDPGYRDFSPSKLAGERNERVQIGYRLAHRLGLDRVYAIDEQPSPGEPDYFPFGRLSAFAKENGLEARLGLLMAAGAEVVRRTKEIQARGSIADMLMFHNDPGSATAGIDPYYGLLAIGGVDEQPGADLNAMWYLRNAKIFAKLMKAARPGDRVLVVYGSGHGYWLRHFADHTPGYRNVDPMPYLKRAAAPTLGSDGTASNLEQRPGLRALHPNASVEQVVFNGRQALRVRDTAGLVAGDRLVMLPVGDFKYGVIEGYLAGQPSGGAGPGARGFVGIAFRVQADPSRYEAFYIRPANGRADDQLRRNRSTQYISHPDFTWERLRAEHPGVYESYADMAPGEWLRFRIEVEGTRARLFLGEAGQPALVVNDLKLGDVAGGVALWVGPEAEGYFDQVLVTR